MCCQKFASLPTWQVRNGISVDISLTMRETDHFFIYVVVTVSVIQSCPTLQPNELHGAVVQASPKVCSNSCPLSQWCHPTISSSVITFSSSSQSFPASGAFLINRLCASGGQSIGASASASVLPMNIQGWFPLGLTGWISLLFKGFSRVFSSTTVRKHQFFGAQPCLYM